MVHENYNFKFIPIAIGTIGYVPIIIIIIIIIIITDLFIVDNLR